MRKPAKPKWTSGLVFALLRRKKSPDGMQSWSLGRLRLRRYPRADRKRSRDERTVLRTAVFRRATMRVRGEIGFADNGRSRGSSHYRVILYQGPDTALRLRRAPSGEQSIGQKAPLPLALAQRARWTIRAADMLRPADSADGSRCLRNVIERATVRNSREACRFQARN